MKVAIAYRKRTASHCIVRAIPRELADSEVFECSFDQLNKLLIAKTQSQLLDAISDLPPLVPLRYFDGKVRIATLGRGEVEQLSLLSECDRESLQLEFYIDSASYLRANAGTLDALIKNYGADASTITARIEKDGLDKESQSLIIESVSDWVLFRNLASISARLLGLLEQGDEHILETAGFCIHRAKALGKTVFSIPVMGDFLYSKPGDAVGTLGELISGNLSSVPSLYTMLAITRPVKKKGLNNKSIYVDFLGAEKDIFFSTKPETIGSAIAIYKEMRKGDFLQTIHLCIEKRGSQEDMAKHLLQALKNAFRFLSYAPARAASPTGKEPKKAGEKGLPYCGVIKKDKRIGAPKENLIGWYHDEDADLLGLAQPKTDFYSFASALWYTLLFHKGKRITICGYCGNASLSNERGTKKEYCNDSCRVRAAEQRRNEGDENDESAALQGIVPSP